MAIFASARQKAVRLQQREALGLEDEQGICVSRSVFLDTSGKPCSRHALVQGLNTFRQPMSDR